MIEGHPHIGLFRPEIPQNTGNIARLSAAAGCRLHLVPPFGFDAGDKQLRRAGLDYWPFVDLEIHPDLPSLLQLFRGKVALLSTKAHRPYWEIPDGTTLFLFGQETAGLPAEVRAAHPESVYQIPMFHPSVRSQNLANAVAIVVYERLRRLYAASAPNGAFAHDIFPQSIVPQTNVSHAPQRDDPTFAKPGMA